MALDVLLWQWKAFYVGFCMLLQQNVSFQAEGEEDLRFGFQVKGLAFWCLVTLRRVPPISKQNSKVVFGLWQKAPRCTKQIYQKPKRRRTAFVCICELWRPPKNGPTPNMRPGPSTENAGRGQVDWCGGTTVGYALVQRGGLMVGRMRFWVWVLGLGLVGFWVWFEFALNLLWTVSIWFGFSLVAKYWCRDVEGAVFLEVRKTKFTHRSTNWRAVCFFSPDCFETLFAQTFLELGWFVSLEEDVSYGVKSHEMLYFFLPKLEYCYMNTDIDRHVWVFQLCQTCATSDALHMLGGLRCLKGQARQRNEHQKVCVKDHTYILDISWYHWESFI